MASQSRLLRVSRLSTAAALTVPLTDGRNNSPTFAKWWRSPRQSLPQKPHIQRGFLGSWLETVGKGGISFSGFDSLPPSQIRRSRFARGLQGPELRNKVLASSWRPIPNGGAGLSSWKGSQGRTGEEGLAPRHRLHPGGPSGFDFARGWLGAAVTSSPSARLASRRVLQNVIHSRAP
jgi:hypothetical protein